MQEHAPPQQLSSPQLRTPLNWWSLALALSLGLEHLPPLQLAARFPQIKEETSLFGTTGMLASCFKILCSLAIYTCLKPLYTGHLILPYIFPKCPHFKEPPEMWTPLYIYWTLWPGSKVSALRGSTVIVYILHLNCVAGTPII